MYRFIFVADGIGGNEEDPRNKRKSLDDRYLVPDLVRRRSKHESVAKSNKVPSLQAFEAIRPTMNFLLNAFIMEPNVNPIENAFAKLKAILKKIAARTIDELWAAIGQAVDQFTPTECASYFDAAGYDPI